VNNYQDIPKSIFVITIVIIALSSPYLIASGSNNRILAQDTGKKSVSVNYLDKHLPVNLSVASTGSNSSHIFIFGGTNDLWIGTDGIYLLDTQTFTSTRIGSLPAPAYGMGTVQIDNLVYLIGGFSNGTSLDSILCFNIDTLSFEQVNSVLPRGLEGPIVVEISGKIYIFCGLTFNVGFSDQVFKFDPQLDTIETLDLTMPLKLVGATSFWTGSELMIFGGKNTDTTELTDKVWAFNPETLSLYEREEKLPFPCMFITKLVVIDNLLYTSSLYNSSGYHNVIYEINLDIFEFNLIQDDYLSSGRRSYMICQDDLHVILLGGIPSYIYADDSIIQVDISRLTHDTVMLEPDSQDWDINGEENFWFENNRLSWQTKNSICNATKEFKRVTKENDRLELEVVYHNHSDVNSRQMVNIGWTYDANTTPVNLGISTIYTSKNFIGITVRNGFPTISVIASVIKDERYLARNQYILKENTIHHIRLQVFVMNDTHYEQKITVDGLVLINKIVEENIVGMEFNSFAIWNQNSSLLEIEGEYRGSLTFARYSENEEITLNSRNLLLEGLILFIMIILAFSAYMLFITQTRKHYRYAKGPDEIPNKLIPSTAYKLYCSLDRAFKRLERISGFYVVNDQPVSDETGIVERWKEWEEVDLPDFDFTQFSGTSLEIMIYLLDYLDHGTYSSVIKEDLGLNKSTVAYNVHLLEKKGLIKVSLTPTGRGLLFQIYKKLEKYFS